MILIIPKVIIILISILIIILILIYLIYISFIVEVIWCCIYPWFYCFSCFLVLLCFLDRCLLLRWYFPTFQEMLLSSLSSSVQFSFSLKFFKVNITFSFCSSFASFNFYPSFFIHSAFLPLPFSEILHFFFLLFWIISLNWFDLYPFQCKFYYLHNTALHISCSLSSSFPFVLLYQVSAENLQVLQVEIHKVAINFDGVFLSCLIVLLTLQYS